MLGGGEVTEVSKERRIAVLAKIQGSRVEGANKLKELPSWKLTLYIYI